MGLQADGVDRDAPLQSQFQVLEHRFAFCLCPVLARFQMIFVPDEHGFRIRSGCGAERVINVVRADEIDPGFAAKPVGALFVWIQSFIDHVPGMNFSGVMANDRGNMVQHQIFSVLS